jgi:phage tail protein X
MPTIKAAAPPTDPRVGLTSSPTESAPAVTTIEPVAALEPTFTGVTVRTDDAAPRRPDGRIGVIVRPGDTLLRLCLSVYGRCGRATLRLVLETNPQIRSARYIVSGQKVVFPPPRPAGSGSDKR